MGQYAHGFNRVYVSRSGSSGGIVPRFAMAGIELYCRYLKDFDVEDGRKKENNIRIVMADKDANNVSGAKNKSRFFKPDFIFFQLFYPGANCSENNMIK